MKTHIQKIVAVAWSTIVIVTCHGVLCAADSQSKPKKDASQIVSPQVHLRMIVVKKITNDPSSCELAAQILQLIRSGKPFGTVAEKFSEDEYRAQQGDRGWVEPRALGPELATAAMALKPGQISEVIETSDGCYIMLVEEFRPTQRIPVAESGKMGPTKKSNSSENKISPKVFAAWKSKAEQGDANAQFELANMYAQGEGVGQNIEEAAKWMQKAAGQNHTGAQLEIGRMYAHGAGVARDMIAAITWFRKAAAKNHAAAQRFLGIALYAGSGDGDAKGYPEALLWLRKAADQGDAEAQVLAGMMLAKGEGTKAAPAEAAKWIRKAAELEHGAAMLMLGMLIQNGIGVQKDMAEGTKWVSRGINKALKETPDQDSLTQSLALDALKAPAEKGDAIPQMGLARCYAEGRGTKQDYSEAVKWYRKAADQNYDEAQVELGMAYEKGLGIAKNPAEAVKWYRKAAEQNRADAQFNLGVMLEAGNGVPEDKAEAVKWYQKAADQDIVNAQVKMGSAYLNGIGVGRDYLKAMSWFKKAAEQNNVEAQMYLANMYGQGMGARASLVEASKWFRKAAEQGNGQAQFNLAAMLSNGIGVQQNGVEAVEWFKKAAAQGEITALAALGQLYFEGTGVPKNYVEAYAYSSLASASDPSAANNKDFISQKMSAEQLLEGKKRIAELRTVYAAIGVAINGNEALSAQPNPNRVSPKATTNQNSREKQEPSGQRNGEDEYSVGLKYFLEKDYVAALKSFRGAAEKGNVTAQFRLGEMYSEALGVPRNLIEAYAWFYVSDPLGRRVMGQDKLAVVMSTEEIATAKRRAKAILEVIEQKKR